MTLYQSRYRVETARRAQWDYSAPGWYFVTICTRECSLGRGMGGEIILAAAGIIAEAQLRQIQEHYSNVRVDRFVVMPNHIHAIIVIEGRRSKSFGERPGGAENKSPAGSLGDVVGAYKAGVTRACRLAELRDFAWQPRFYDRILHSNASVNAVRDYMDRNPRNWREDPDRVTVQTEKRAGHPEQG